MWDFWKETLKHTFYINVLRTPKYFCLSVSKPIDLMSNKNNLQFVFCWIDASQCGRPTPLGKRAACLLPASCGDIQWSSENCPTQCPCTQQPERCTLLVRAVVFDDPVDTDWANHRGGCPLSKSNATRGSTTVHWTQPTIETRCVTSDSLQLLRSWVVPFFNVVRLPFSFSGNGDTRSNLHIMINCRGLCHQC